MTEDRHNRSSRLIGKEGLARLKNSRVALFGLGGVGSFAAEALARSGVGHLQLFDFDRYDPTNLNRQLGAIPETAGQPKTAVTAGRIARLDPEIAVETYELFVSRDTRLPFERTDFVIDAVDNVTAKLTILEQARSAGIPVISVMGTGNKLHPELLTVSDLFETRECPLCRVMRAECRKRGIGGVRAIWSPEHPITEGKSPDGERSPGSMIFVPAAAGMIAAAEAVRTLAGFEK